jgi:hypothetical protein
MTLDEILDEWKSDIPVDRLNLSGASTDNTKLHEKYYRMYAAERMAFFKLEGRKSQFLDFLARFYLTNGVDCNADELKKYGYEPLDTKTVIKADLDRVIGADRKWIAMNLQVSEQKLKCDMLLDIIKAVKERGYGIKNAIEIIKFEGGV